MTRQYKTPIMAPALMLLLFASASPSSASPASTFVKASQALIKKNNQLIKSKTLNQHDMIEALKENALLHHFIENYNESAKYARKTLELDPADKEASTILKSALTLTKKKTPPL